MKTNNKLSKWIYGGVVAIIIIVHLAYPKWTMHDSEATLSWDVSGYYMYLPAIFIYNDIKGCAFKDEILEKYKPTPDFQQGYLHESGNYVLKYSVGQAVQYAPFFFVAHAWASMSTTYAADGFSFPYQFMISLGSLLIAFLGLFYLRKTLLLYFEDRVVASTLLILVLGTNYLNYIAIDGAMTHNTLFTLYALLIYASVRYYQAPSNKYALAIGMLVGLMALTRPTELLGAVIPVLWGVNVFSLQSIQRRLLFFVQHWSQLLLAVFACGAIGFIQLAYWKYATGDWIVYSYQDQGFSWRSPHIIECLFSYKAGWLIYTPVMVFALLGFYGIYKRHRDIFGGVFIFSVLFMYVAFAWDIWWYGGSLGQRTMVQAYAVLSFPLSAFLAWGWQQKSVVKLIFSGLLLTFFYLNIWWTYQAHVGGLFKSEQMTRGFFWQVLGRYQHSENDLKLLDNPDHLRATPQNIRTIYNNSFDNETCVLEESAAICLNAQKQWSEIYFIDTNNDFAWVRATADFKITAKEWHYWLMTQFIVRFYKGDNLVHERAIRVHRLLEEKENKRLYIDVKNRDIDFDKLGILFWNATGQKEMWIDNLTVEVFD